MSGWFESLFSLKCDVSLIFLRLLKFGMHRIWGQSQTALWVKYLETGWWWSQSFEYANSIIIFFKFMDAANFKRIVWYLKQSIMCKSFQCCKSLLLTRGFYNAIDSEVKRIDLPWSHVYWSHYCCFSKSHYFQSSSIDDFCYFSVLRDTKWVTQSKT